MRLSICLVGLLLVVELSVRAVGALNFPLTQTHETIGYLPKANQNGSFLHTNTWSFNDKGMGTPAKWAPSDKSDVLLIGDSVVHGGNKLAQSDKLGPRLNDALGEGYTVWPMAAKSWGLRNELAWLLSNPDVVKATEHIVLVLNDADFGPASKWSSEHTHPTKYPVFATWYLFEKHVVNRIRVAHVRPKATKTAVALPLEQWETFVDLAGNKPITIVRHPFKSSPAPNQVDSLKTHASIYIVDVRSHPMWGQLFYTDDIHPNKYGVWVLARILAEHLKPLT